MTRNLSLLTLAALLITGCGGAPAATVTPPAAATPAPSERTDDERAALMRDSIELVYGTDPQPDWWSYLNIVDGEIDLLTDGNSLFVAAPSIPDDLAQRMCQDIAAVVFDADAEPIGIRHVHIMSSADVMAGDCDSVT